MSYFTRLQVICQEPLTELIMAEISYIGFDTFLETETGFEAYAENENYDKTAFQEIKARYLDNPENSGLVFYLDRLEKKNWNQEWENSYEPVLVGSTVRIRAHFHAPDPSYPIELIITPKMSFGTGHHQTTCLMIAEMLKLDFQNRRVLDAGTGTGVLAILAAKLGASAVDAYDIDEWSITNSRENIEVNEIQLPIRLQQGTITTVQLNPPYDIVLANINRNILLEEIPAYASVLPVGGQLLLSGFYVSDRKDLIHRAAEFSLRHTHAAEMEQWSTLLFTREANF